MSIISKSTMMMLASLPISTNLKTEIVVSKPTKCVFVESSVPQTPNQVDYA